MSETERLSRLITYLQTMQSSYRSIRKSAKTDAERRECDLVRDVLGDVIRFAAELRAGDGSRANLPDATQLQKPGAAK